MISAPLGDALNHLQHLFRDGTSGRLTDGQLVDRFVSGRDESAFAALVQRHGPMVLRICRAVLADEHDAQDAFQATFLVLVQKSHAMADCHSIGPWLVGVSFRVAKRARADTARRRVREMRSAEWRARSHEPGPSANLESWPEVYAELNRLPEKYRVPLVLCYLEGHTVEEVAQQLGCPRGTILSRLARARDRLRGRLARHGLVLPVAALVALHSPRTVAATVPVSLAESTVQAAIRLATDGTVAIAVAKLVAGVVPSTTPTPLKFAITGLLATGIAAMAILIEQAPVPGQPTPPGERSRSLAQKDLGKKEQIRGPGTALIPRVVNGRTLQAHSSAGFCVAFSPDGKRLASGGADGTVKIWDPAIGASGSTFRILPRAGKHAAVMALAFSLNNALLAAACDDLTIRLIDAVTGDERDRIPQDYFANTLAFSPDGRTLAWAGTNPKNPDPTAGTWREITLWDVVAGKVRLRLTGHTDGISSLAFSADGTMIISGSYDGTVRLWQTDSGRELASLKGQQPIHSVAIAPDQQVIAAATGHRYRSNDGQTPTNQGVVTLWDVASRLELASLPEHTGAALTVAFSPNGKVVASGGHDGMIKLWDRVAKKERASLVGHQGNVYALTFSPDGRTLASTGLDSTVRVWLLGELD